MRSMAVSSRPIAWLGEKKLSRVMLVFGVVLLLSIVLGTFSYLLVQDLMTMGTYPPGVNVIGVDVSGLTKAEAFDLCNSELEEIINKPVSLNIDNEKYQITPDEIGLKLELGDMIDQVYEKAWSVNIFERMGRRFINKPKEIDAAIAVQSDGKKVEQFVDTALNMINRPPHDTYIDVTSGIPVIVPAKEGRYADRNQLLDQTLKALGTADREVQVDVARSPAAITDEVWGQFIVISLAEHTLTLYNREQPLVQYGVACGSPSYPTPAGIWKIVGKQRNPSWINPGTAWASTMPPYIAPGPGNPLGTRALPLNASGVLIHGTSSDWSIGRSASHGCIRMHMKDVEALFELVEAETPVYIIKAAGNPGFDVTKKPFWQK
ncbi:MAG: L,D-transpeptidase/peptidoglycan binding protein [Actinobacteria bacterium]|nr:L,D-transpeptidase/peptidoglycan binding protein [Actinomycetota bacterium]